MSSETWRFFLLIWPFAWAVPPAASSAEPVYSPYADATYPTRVLWGDTHLHTTTRSMRAPPVSRWMWRTRTSRAGRDGNGDERSTAKLSRPLDFLVVTDHSDALGVVDQVIRGNPELLANPELRALHDEFNKGSEGAAKAMEYISRTLLEGGPSPLLNPALMRSTWEQYVETADRFNEPGRFTAMIGYEWTPTISGDKLHRNVLYRDDAQSARRLLPFTAAESIHPEALWRWMQRYEDETGPRAGAGAQWEPGQWQDVSG